MHKENVDMKVQNGFPIKSDVKSLGAIINSDIRYRIPEYQRPYEWTENNIDEFLNSIIDGFKASTQGRPVFFGTIQFDIRDGKIDIVDGQQRLTTFLLLLSVIREISSGQTPTYDGLIEKKGFSEELKKPVSTEFREYSSENNVTNYYKNKIHLYEKLIRLNTDEGIEFEKLYNFVINSVYFVRLETREMQLADVISVFNTINTTGLDLNASDIFKIKYYDYLSENHPCSQDEDWMAMINKCYMMVEEANVKLEDYQSKIDMAWILDVYKHIICARFELGYSELSKSNVTFFEDLFGGQINQSYMKDYILKYESFESLVSMFIEYYRWLEKAINLDKYPDYHKELFSYHMLQKTRYTQYWTIPFVAAFYALRNGNYSKEQVFINSLRINLSFFKYFFIYSVIYSKVIYSVRNTTCKLLSTFVNEDYTKICSKVEDIKWLRWGDINNPTDEKEDENRWERKDFRNCISKNLYDNGRVRMVCVLSALIDEIEAGSSSDDIIQKLFNWSKQQYDIEHIWARDLYEKNKDLNKENKEELNGIGNLVVLNRSINRKIQNNSTNKKKEQYLSVPKDEYGYKIVEILCDKYDLENWQDLGMVQVRNRQEAELNKIDSFMDDRSYYMND